MNEDEFIRGSGNVYADLGLPDAGLAQARAIVAARIICILDERGLSTREAEKLTGVSHSEFSRIRNTQLRRFTLDRLILLLGKLEPGAEVSIHISPAKTAAPAQAA
jgi:predicted XRE-type DNA-binding protein